MTARLRLDHIADVDAVTVEEEVSLFQSASVSQWREVSENFDPTYARSLHFKINGTKERLIGRFRSSGFAVANSDLFYCVQRPIGNGFPSVFNIDRIVFDRNDNVKQLKGHRNTGWSIAEPGEIILPASAVNVTSSLQCAKILCRDLEFAAYDEQAKALKINNELARNLDDFITYDDRRFVFASGSGNGIIEWMTGSSDRQEQLDKILFQSLQTGRLEDFRRALTEGANPDQSNKPDGLPLVFGLAADGMIEWIDALLECGRCDLTVRDKNGLPASHAPGVTAVKFGPTSSRPDPAMFERYQDIANRLEAEEILQHDCKSEADLSLT